ncbi:hypothetical protein [Roseateles sp. P5_E7]
MKNGTRRLAALLLSVACLLPLGARAQDADPAVWGVYAQLIGAKLASPPDKGGITYSWRWNSGRTAIIETLGAESRTSEISSLGDGKLARNVDGKQTWTGTIEPDGAVVWDPIGFMARLAGTPHRVRLDGDALLMDRVELKDGRVVQSSPLVRLVGSLPVRAPVAAAAASAAEPASAPVAPTQIAIAAQAPEAATDEPVAAPRTLSAEDLVKLRAGMARDKVQRAEMLKRQQEEARQQQEAQRQRAELEAHERRMAAQRAAEERDEERASSDAFAGALMSGLNTFKNEVAKNQAQHAQQQAFVANLQRQQQQAADARQREQDRQRQAAAPPQPYRQPQATAQQQQQRPPAGTTVASNSQPGQAAQASQPTADAADRALRERAAAERQRLQLAAAPQRTTPATPAAVQAPAPRPEPAERAPTPYAAVLKHNMSKGSKSNVHPTCYSNVLRLRIPAGQSPASVIEPLYAQFVSQCQQTIDGVLRGPLTASPGWSSDMSGDDFGSLLRNLGNWKENVQVHVSAP